MPSSEVLDTIPHRPPFLFVDSVEECSGDSITCRQTFRADSPFFAGHYPGRPITPGVLLCESVFQAGAILLTRKMKAGGGTARGRTPVLCRIEEAKFKSIVQPDDELTVQVSIRESLQDFHFLTGKVFRAGKPVLVVRFAITLSARDATAETGIAAASGLATDNADNRDAPAKILAL